MSEKKFETILSHANDTYLPLIERQLESHEITFGEYAKRCVINAIASINQMLSDKGITWSDKSLDQSNITQILLNIASLELNAAAEPSECYFQIRNVKKGNDWKKMIEFGVQASGNDAILSRFGRDVKKVYPCWIVREDDDFTYPRYTGIEMEPPTWTPKGIGKVVRVVYPILHTDNSIHYYIGERADVARNLLAHINNNMMNETFGICKDRYNATPDQLKKIAAKKAEIKNRAKDLGLDAIDDPELSQYISPSWKEDFSRESMILRKIQNNIVKKIPKDFGHSIVQEAYSETTDEGYRHAKENIVESTATVEVDEIIPIESPQEGQNEPVADENQSDSMIEPSESKSPSEDEISGQLRLKPLPDNRQKPNFD